jgi:hypothetical protein
MHGRKLNLPAEPKTIDSCTFMGIRVMQQDLLPVVEHRGVSSGMTIHRPAPGIAVLVLYGTDVGEFGDFPMRELGRDLQQFDAIELFVDARAVKGASVDVSSGWAFWMSAHRTQLRQINMLTGTRYVQITADFVRRFVGLVDRMKIFTDQRAFDESLAAAVRMKSC